MSRAAIAGLLLAAGLAGGHAAAAGASPVPERGALAAPAEPLRAALRDGLRRALGRLSEELPGVSGFMVRDLTSGETFETNADLLFPVASVIKLPVFLEVLRQAEEGSIDLSRRRDIDPRARTTGGGVLQTWSPPLPQLSVGELAILMMDFSDNFATNLLIDQIGLERVNRRLRGWGFRETRLQRKIMDLEAARAGRENVSTPREMAALLEKLVRGEILDAESTRRAIAVMKANQNDPPRRTPIKQSLPEDVEVADKEGELEGVRCAAGIVFVPASGAPPTLPAAGSTRPFVLAVMTTYLKDDAAGAAFISAVSRAAFDYFTTVAMSSGYGRRLPP